MIKNLLPALPLKGDRLGSSLPIKHEELQRHFFSLLAGTEFLEDESPHSTFILYWNACDFRLLYTRDRPVPVEYRPFYRQSLEEARTARPAGTYVLFL
jgi:hypothetical protein